MPQVEVLLDAKYMREHPIKAIKMPTGYQITMPYRIRLGDYELRFTTLACAVATAYDRSLPVEFAGEIIPVEEVVKLHAKFQDGAGWRREVQ